jgi:hypothetical protein
MKIITFFKTLPTKTQYIFATCIALLTTGLWEYYLGRVIICSCGYIKFWHGSTWSSENSQHITDWYTFSHIIHGFIFYYLGKFVLKLSLFQSFLVALGIASLWEIFENTNFVINRYREATISLHYYGDSILNSLTDILAMVLGFYLAKKLPAWMIVLLMFVMEIGVGFAIRDNLSLNVLMLIHPFQDIKAWQMGSN